MLDDSDKARGMLFESEAWPLPFESNKIQVACVPRLIQKRRRRKRRKEKGKWRRRREEEKEEDSGGEKT